MGRVRESLRWMSCTQELKYESSEKPLLLPFSSSLGTRWISCYSCYKCSTFVDTSTCQRGLQVNIHHAENTDDLTLLINTPAQVKSGKLLLKFHKNVINIDISLYQIYLPKLHENILKYFRLNLFREITISFNHGLRTTSELPASLSDALLV